jgi:tubulin polyglutamylase TTLL9
MFVEEFKRAGGIWIMKPIGSAQGKGIFLFSRLSEISEWRPDLVKNTKGGARAKEPEEKDVEAYVVQKYLQYPLLVGGKKFDMRLYSLITSFSPLKVFQYRRGFARFTNSRYSSDVEDIYNGFMHLTNVAIQKTAENYDERTGGKMELQAMKLYLASRYGMDRVDALFWEIQMIMVRTLIAVQPIMINDRHCFELYGFDVMIDQDLKPWLIEVNASPSLTANTREDYLMKTEMLHGMLDVVDIEQVLTGDEEHVSGWDVVYDNGYIEIDPEQCGYSTFLGNQIFYFVSFLPVAYVVLSEYLAQVLFGYHSVMDIEAICASKHLYTYIIHLHLHSCILFAMKTGTAIPETSARARGGGTDVDGEDEDEEEERL